MVKLLITTKSKELKAVIEEFCPNLTSDGDIIALTIPITQLDCLFEEIYELYIANLTSMDWDKQNWTVTINTEGE